MSGFLSTAMSWSLQVSFYIKTKSMLDKDQLLLDLFQAYYDARQHKKNKATALAFEINYESKLFALHQELVSGSYIISPSICFIIRDPVQREVFAADFIDRIVHHLIYNYLYPLFDKHFIYDSYSCRIGKWTHFGVQRVKRFFRACSYNFTQKTYVLKMDIKGFFMSINKEILFAQVENFLIKHKKQLTIDYDFLLQLIRQTIFHDPTNSCSIKWSKNDWEWLPNDKSLFHSGQHTGLAIGNLTSQLFANVYLDDLDKYIKYQLWFSSYGRYVDDFFIVHQDKEKLLETIPEIRDFLREKLKLILHPKKIYLQEIKKWVLFLGVYIKPYRSYVRRRTIGKFYHKIQKLNQTGDKEKILSTINSYLWICSHHKSYHICQKMWKKCGNYIWNTFTLTQDYRKLEPVVKKLKCAEVKKLYPQWYYNGNLR